MRITAYVPMSKAQEQVLDDLQRISVRAALVQPWVEATVKTFQGQLIKLSINESGVIQNVWIEEGKTA